MINKKKAQQLLSHLHKLGELTGKPLLKRPRFPKDMRKCPMLQFAPPYDSDNNLLCCANGRGVTYFKGDSTKAYNFFSVEDSEWWQHLTYEQHKEYLLWLTNKLQEAIK